MGGRQGVWGWVGRGTLSLETSAVNLLLPLVTRDSSVCTPGTEKDSMGMEGRTVGTDGD